jgi:hypothetical protein
MGVDGLVAPKLWGVSFSHVHKNHDNTYVITATCCGVSLSLGSSLEYML